MNNHFLKSHRSFGNELQNVFSFLNKSKNIKNVKNKNEYEKLIKIVKKAQILQKNQNKRNSMFMMIPKYPIQYIKNNNGKENNNGNLFEIKEEENIIRKTIGPNEANAVTKGGLEKNIIKEEKILVKDYFNSLLDDYGNDIFNHIKRNEKINIFDYSSRDLFKLQDKKYFNEKNRSIIFQWLVKNNHKWRLKDDTIFMAMNIMDRYISMFKVDNKEFQLVGISSYLIASKYEDIYPPYVDELCQICNFIYTIDDIIKKEYEILAGLNFDILYNSSYKFLTFLHSIVENENKKLFYLAQFILELSLENVEILEYSQIKRALASLLIAKKILQIKKSWNILRMYYDYDENEIKNVQKKLIILLNKVMKSKNNNAIFEKFQSLRYKSISSFLDNLINKSQKKERKNENKENNNKYNDENNNNENY